MKFFDLHCDTATKIYDKKVAFESRKLHINAQKMTDFNQISQVFAVFFNDIKQKTGLNYFYKVMENFIGQIKNIENLIPIFSVEGGGQMLENNLDNMEVLNRFNIKIFGLVWNGENFLATGALKDNSKGLTNFGIVCVKKLRKLNIIPDVSHLSDAGFNDLAECCDVFIATHSNSRKIFEHPRNLKDSQIKTIIERKGLIGLNLYPVFMTKNKKNAEIELLSQHIDHFLDLGGIDVLAMGCDFDGIDRLPKKIHGLQDINILREMLDKKYSLKIADKIMYDNACNFFVSNNLL